MVSSPSFFPLYTSPYPFPLPSTSPTMHQPLYPTQPLPHLKKGEIDWLLPLGSKREGIPFKRSFRARCYGSDPTKGRGGADEAKGKKMVKNTG